MTAFTIECYHGGQISLEQHNVASDSTPLPFLDDTPVIRQLHQERLEHRLDSVLISAVADLDRTCIAITLEPAADRPPLSLSIEVSEGPCDLVRISLHDEVHDPLVCYLLKRRRRAPERAATLFDGNGLKLQVEALMDRVVLLIEIASVASPVAA